MEEDKKGVCGHVYVRVCGEGGYCKVYANNRWVYRVQQAIFTDNRVNYSVKAAL